MDAHQRKASHGRIRYRRLGVYDVAYEDAAPPLTLRIYVLLNMLDKLCNKMPAVWRFLTDTLQIAPLAFIAYMATSVWKGVSYAIHLYWLSVLFDRVGHSLTGGTVSPEELPSIAASWLCCAAITLPVDRIHAQSLAVLTKRCRAYFLPQLIRASLRFDVLSIQDLPDVFPIRCHFASEFPGGPCLKELGCLVQHTLDLVCQVRVLLHAISAKQSPEREVLTCLCIARGFVAWLAPPHNGIGSKAYVYWPHNRYFKRMKTLFGLAFSTKYRADLVLDGVTSDIATEYDALAERLGDADILEPTPWCTGLTRDWVWDFMSWITSDGALATYALICSADLTPSSISSMALLLQVTSSISSSVWRYAEETPGLVQVCSHAEHLYDAIDYKSTMHQGTEPYPRAVDGVYDAGMKISFRDVSLRYPGGTHDALHHVSFDISPGELVLVVGANGSGKSTVLKLLARLFDPTQGEVWVDDRPLKTYTIEGLRRAVVFQAQTPVIYPASVRANIACSLSSSSPSSTYGAPTEGKDDDDDDDACHKGGQEEKKRARVEVEAAARMGSCAEWIARLGEGYDTPLRPTVDVDLGWADGFGGYPSEVLRAELARHRGPSGVSLSAGEKQRLASARTCTRLDTHTKTTRLLLVDEATSALDPLAERAVLTGIVGRARAGRTVVVVAHRFHHLAHVADRILCLKAGSVVECGTHVQLVRRMGEYAALYYAQVRQG